MSTQPTGGQPAPETVETAMRDGGQLVRDWAAQREAAFAMDWDESLFWFEARALTLIELKHIYELAYQQGALAEAKKVRDEL